MNILFAVIVILLSIVSAIVLAGPKRAAATTQAPVADWSGTLTVKSDIPFLWLRTEPSSTAIIVETAYPGSTFAAVGSAADLKFDGTQWWGKVRYLSATGWVEVARTAHPTTAPSAPKPSDWGSNFTVAPNIPFLWLRNEPSSGGGVIATIYAGNIFVAVGTAKDLKWDGVQWWGQVKVGAVTGWVELTRVVRSNGGSIPAAPPALPNGDNFLVARNIPFLWLRREPSSGAPVITTIYPGTTFTTVGGSSNLRWDGVQWWTQINTSSTAGWVEYSRVEPANLQTCTPTCRKQLISPDCQHQWPMDCSFQGIDTPCTILFPNGQKSEWFAWPVRWSVDNQLMLVPEGGTHDSPAGGYEIWRAADGVEMGTVTPMRADMVWWAPSGHSLYYVKIVNYPQSTLVLVDENNQQNPTRQCPDWVITKTIGYSDPLDWSKLCDNWKPS